MEWGLAIALGVAVVASVVAWGQLGRANLERRDQVDALRRTIDAGDEKRREAVGYSALLESSLDAVPQGVLLVSDNGDVVFRNQFASTFESARHADALVEAAVAELVADAVESRQGSERQLEQFGPPRRTIVVSVTPLAVERRTFGVLALIEDVTERRRLEAVRRDFVANISHELKTPIGALSLLAETLAAEDDPEVAQRLAGRMQNESERVARTIDDLLELTRIESEEAPRHDVVPVSLLVDEAVIRIAPAAEQFGISVVADGIDPRLCVFGDRRQLISALYNLLENAVKYSDAGEAVEVSATTDGMSVALTVSDHGMGIPAKDHDRIFERFYRVDAARSRQTGGTGLGLAIVRHVLANHDGDVTVESRLGEGTAFTLRLPSASEPLAVSVASTM